MSVNSPANPIKSAIMTHLRSLVATQVLGDALEYDLSKDPLSDTKMADAFPLALLGTCEIGPSEYITNRANWRTYKFPVMVIQKFDNTSAPTDVEDLMDAVCNEIDNDPTLGGACNMVEAVTTPLPAISTPDKTYVLFLVNINARMAIQLTF